MGGMCRFNEPGKLSTIDGLGEFAMQKCIFHIKLVDWPFVGSERLSTTRMVAGLTTGLNVSP
jgi:hypothetical protein